MSQASRSITILFVAVLTAISVTAQAELDVRVTDVPDKVAAIDEALSTYSKTHRQFSEGTATIFRSDGAVKKIVAEVVWHNGRDWTERISENYFADGKLIYVSESFDRYDEREAKDPSASKTPVPPPQKSYFYKGKLVLFLKGGKAIDWMKPEFDRQEAWTTRLVAYILDPDK